MDVMASLSAQNLRFGSGAREILRGVSFDLFAGELVGLMGRNGAGKTSLLRILLGLAHPQGGAVRISNVPLEDFSRPEIAARIAYVPQVHLPTFPFTVHDIVQMGVRRRGRWPRRDPAVKDIVGEALERMGIGDLADRPCTTLSGGETQAMLISRALAQGARIMVMDEPAAALDPGQQQRLMRNLRELAGEGYTILFSVHQFDLVRAWADRLLLLHGGNMVADGSPAAVLQNEMIDRCFGDGTSDQLGRSFGRS
jgi:iron complex transport system ATP-binding protein